MRIAIFSEVFLPKVDGIVNTLCRMLEYLERGGHSALMIAPEGAPAEYASTPILQAPAAPLPLYPELRFSLPVNLPLTELDAFSPDIIHVVNPLLLGAAGIRYARQRGRPVVASYHTDLAGYATRWKVPWLTPAIWFLLRRLHNNADLNLCPSSFSRNDLIGNGIRRVRLWTRGVDTQRFNPVKYDSHWRWQLSAGHPEAPLLLYTGRLSPEKRVEWLIPLLQRHPGARLAVVGDGPQRQELETQFGDLPVVFTGYLQGEALSSAFASSDLFVFPAANETFGNVVLEAMASGLPVVTAARGGPLDFVQPGRNGMLFPADDHEAFLAAADQLLRSPSRIQRMGMYAREDALQHSWDGVFDRLLADYRSVLRWKKPRTYRPRPSRRLAVRAQPSHL